MTGSLKPRIIPSLSVSTSSLYEPTSYSQAIKDNRWLHAMSEEYDALVRNNTWTLVPCPVNANLVGNKWVYRIKYCSDGSIDSLRYD